MPELKLISHRLCPYVQRARVVLAEKDIEHKLAFIDLSRKPDWFTAISPLGKVPVLLVDGEPLFESAAIAEYLDDISPGSLHPHDPFERARHRAWIEFASQTLDDIAAFYSAPDAGALERGRLALAARFERLERVLGDGPFFAGEQFSLVDAAFGPVFRYFDVFERIDDFAFFAAAAKVRAYRAAVQARPSVLAAAVPDYRYRLSAFLAARGGELAARIVAAKAS